MPAFSFAISIKLLPKNSLWSNPIFVIRETRGFKIFVESNLPPKPVSITAISTLDFAK